MATLVDMALRLPPEERLALAEKLLESVEGPDDDESRVQAAWGEELQKRSRELREGTAQGLSIEQARKLVASDSDEEP